MGLRERFGLEGRTALVTGGGRGLGAAVARALADAGAAVAVGSRNLDACEAVASELRQGGHRALALRCDVTREGEVEEALERAETSLGPVDILVNNAGVVWGAPAETMPVERVREVLEVNVVGTFLASREVARRRIADGRPASIVNIASVSAFLGAEPGVLEAVGYNAAKGGVVSLTRGLAGSWAHHGIRVNAIAPGWFPTRMSAPVLEAHGEAFLSRIPLGRFGGADDLGGVAIFLASPASAYLTGQTIVVDGGQALW